MDAYFFEDDGITTVALSGGENGSGLFLLILSHALQQAVILEAGGSPVCLTCVSQWSGFSCCSETLSFCMRVPAGSVPVIT